MTDPRDLVSEWLFVLANKGTGLSAWWLKIRTPLELATYLSETGGRYANAFSNYMHDGFYGTGIGHGPYPEHSNLALVAYLRGVNRKQDIVSSLLGLQSETACHMFSALERHGGLYVNANGGWCVEQAESGDFCRRKTLVWPSFTKNQVRISRFPGGRHYYAYVGDVQVRAGDRLKFDDRQSAMRAAEAYITEKEVEA